MQVKHVTGECLHVSQEVLRKCGGRTFNTDPISRGWAPDDGDQLHLIAWKEGRGKLRRWYYLQKQDGTGFFLRLTSAVRGLCELDLVPKSRVPDLALIVVEQICKQEGMSNDGR